MSASTVLIPFPAPRSTSSKTQALPPSGGNRIDPPGVVRRRPDMQQGRALEMLGHAIEYLIDSHMFLVNEPHARTEVEAVQILSRCSREVFATCAEVVPVHQRFKRWAVERLHTSTLSPLGHTSTRRSNS
jgi:hypothetical protein